MRRARSAAPVRVTLLDRHNYHLFQPLLYQVATASLSPGDIASPDPLDSPPSEERPRAAGRARGPSTQPRVECARSTTGRARVPHVVPYDYLIVATGAAHAYFGHPEWADRAPGLKTLDDALEMRRRVLLAFEAAERESDPARQRRLLTFVIVGGGPTGVELAGALAEIARAVAAAGLPQHPARIGAHRPGRRRPEPARARFPIASGDAARRSLERLGVEVLTGSLVTGIDAEGVTWRPRRTDRAAGGSGERIEAQTVLWAAGVAASPLATSLGVPLDRVGRVLAEPTLQVPGHPEIFVVGDICALQQDGKPLPGRGAGRHAGGRACRAQHPARRCKGEAADAVPLSRLRDDGGHRPRIGGRRHRSRRDVGIRWPGSSGCSSTSSG